MNTSLKYNPGLLSDEELVKAFVVRQHDLDVLIQIVDQNTASDSNQHILIVGQRGIGKTTLVRRIAAEIRSKPDDLGKAWVPIVFAEETYSATNVAELWLEALLRVYNQTNESEWLDAYERIRSERDEVRVRDSALGALLDFADRRQAKLLLIIENFSMLIHQFDANASWELRHALSNEKRLMFIATSASRFSEGDDADAAWFQFFVVHELKPLALRQCRALWKALTGTTLPIPQVRAIEILTGGNPRLIRILTDFAVRKSFRELVDNLTSLIDEHTEYFKSQIDGLPPAERKVLVALLENWKPTEAREIAQTARLEVSKTSALLNRLAIERGLVTIKTGDHRKRRYEVSERLFNIYYLMRRQGHPADRVRAAVRFMVELYRDAQLVDTVKRLASEACELDPGLRADHFTAYEEVIRCELEPAVRSAIIDATPSTFALQMPQRLSDLMAGFTRHDKSSSTPAAPKDSVAEKPISQATEAMEREDFTKAEEILLAAIDSDPQNGHLWFHLGAARLAQKKSEGTVDALRKALALRYQIGAWGWGMLSNALHDLGRYAEAAEASREVVSLESEDTDKAHALGVLGHLLSMHLNQQREAEAVLNEALTFDPKQIYPYFVLCHMRLGESPSSRIQDLLDLALQSDNKSAHDWMLFADLLHRKGRYAEAEACLRRILEFEPKNAEAWSHLAELLWFHLSRKEEAEQAIRNCIELDHNNANAHARLAGMLESKGLYDDAEAEAQAATNLDAKCYDAWTALGTLHFNKRNFEQSAQAFRTALQLEPDDFVSWYELAVTLEAGGNTSEAQSAFAKAAEFAKSVPRGRASLRYVHALANVFAKNADWPKALEIARSFIDVADQDEQALSFTTDFIIWAAASNQVDLALATLESSRAKGSYEPLLVAMKMLRDDTVDAPREIAEVAHDIIKRVLAVRNEIALSHNSVN